MKYELMKFRNVYAPDDMPSSEFLYFSSKLQKDNMDKTLDPFPFKQVQNVKVQ